MQSIDQLKKEALSALKAVSSPEGLERFRIEYLGRKGKVSLYLRGVAELPEAKRKAAGMAGNELRKMLEEQVAALEKGMTGKKHALPGRGVKLGKEAGKKTLDVMPF